MDRWKDRQINSVSRRLLLPAIPPQEFTPSSPHTLALPAAYQPVPLGTETSVGAIGVDAITPNAGCREVTLIYVCMGSKWWRTSGADALTQPEAAKASHRAPGGAPTPCSILDLDGGWTWECPACLQVALGLGAWAVEVLG